MDDAARVLGMGKVLPKRSLREWRRSNSGEMDDILRVGCSPSPPPRDLINDFWLLDMSSCLIGYHVQVIQVVRVCVRAHLRHYRRSRGGYAAWQIYKSMEIK